MILCENKRILRKKGSENFEANKRNACETDLCSLRFALKRKKNISENRTPQLEMGTKIMQDVCKFTAVGKVSKDYKKGRRQKP